VEDPSSLPGCLYGASLVVAADPCDGLGGRDAGEDGEDGERGTGATDAAAAGDLYPFGGGTLVGGAQGGDGVVLRGGAAEVGPAHPAMVPVERSGIAGEEVHPELGVWAVRQRAA
jgi:hypothetical protein